MSQNDFASAPAMQGDGFYNRNSAMQAAGISAALPLWEAAYRSVVVGDEPLVIADYGSSQGRNSMAPIGAAIDAVRERCGHDKPVEVFHTDLPGNDFASLFKTIFEDPDSYMAARSSVYPAAIGRSFYEQLLPDGRVHLGWSTWSMQWLSDLVPVPDHIIAGMSRTADGIAAVGAQQASDWKKLLELRSAELRPGGKMLFGYTARSTEETGWEWLLGKLWAALEDMACAGAFTEDELREVTIPIGLRTLAQIREPFEECGTFAGLRLERLELLKLSDPCWDDFMRTRDAHDLATRQVATTRAWAGPTIARLIRPDRDRERLVNELFDRFADLVEAEPRRHEPYMAVVLAAKEGP